MKRTLRHFFVLILILGTCASSFAPDPERLFIVDIDGTLRSTDTRSVGGMMRAFFTLVANRDLPIGHMPELLQIIAQQPNTKIVYLTSTPSFFLAGRQQQFLRRNGFPNPDQIISRGNPLRERTFDYKVGHIERMINEHPNHQVFMIGDNSEKDPEIFREILRRKPNRNIWSYVHQAYTGEIPQDNLRMAPYLSAADLALQLSLRDVLPEQGVETLIADWEQTLDQKGTRNFGADVNRNDVARVIEYLRSVYPARAHSFEQVGESLGRRLPESTLPAPCPTAYQNIASAHHPIKPPGF